MKCRRYERLIQKKLDGLLSERDESALAAHLATCRRCREAMGDYEWIAQGIATQSQVEEVGLSGEVMARIREEGRGLRIWRPAAAIAAAAVVVITLGILFSLREEHTDRPAAAGGGPGQGEVIPTQGKGPRLFADIDIGMPDVVGNLRPSVEDNVRTLRMDAVTTRKALAKAFDEIARELPLI